MNKPFQLMSIEHATHTLTILFGVTSLANVNAFLRDAGHDPLAAGALSLALGAALIVISIALTKIDWQTERPTFYMLAIVGSLLALISGALQSARKGQVWQLIQAGHLSLNQLADQVNVTEKTIDRYISEFRQAGHNITVNGVVKLA